MGQYSQHILVVDDDSKLRALLDQFLTQQGFNISTAKDTADARDILANQSIDIIVMDVMMPNQTGIEFTKELKSNNQTPILLLTAMDEAEDRITGLESGADDYLTKPFEPRELSLRIENLIQRNASHVSQENTTVTFGDYLYNNQNGELRTIGQTEDIPLSSSEQSLLSTLITHLNQPVSREDLATALNGISERSVDVQITRLRKKIETDPRSPQHLRTARGKGYVLKGQMD